MKPGVLVHLIITVITVTTLCIEAIIFAAILPDQIIVHWDASFNPDGWGSKWTIILMDTFIPLGTMALMLLLAWCIPRIPNESVCGTFSLPFTAYLISHSVPADQPSQQGLLALSHPSRQHHELHSVFPGAVLHHAVLVHDVHVAALIAHQPEVCFRVAFFLPLVLTIPPRSLKTLLHFSSLTYVLFIFAPHHYYSPGFPAAVIFWVGFAVYIVGVCHLFAPFRFGLFNSLSYRISSTGNRFWSGLSVCSCGSVAQLTGCWPLAVSPTKCWPPLLRKLTTCSATIKTHTHSIFSLSNFHGCVGSSFLLCSALFVWFVDMTYVAHTPSFLFFSRSLGFFLRPSSI